MLPKLGSAVIRPTRGSSLKPLIRVGTNYIKSIAPLTPALTVRALSIKVPQQVQAVENKQSQHKSTPLKDTATTPQALLDTLEECKATGNLKAAIKNVQYARELGLATPALYLRLVDIMRELPFDVQECATVAHWFYSTDSKLPAEILSDINVWKSVLKLGFRFGSTYRSEDLRALVDRFTEIFDLTRLEDQTAWELLMRAYGMMNRADAISACIAKNTIGKESEGSFYSSALLSYAATNSHENVEKTLEKMKQDNLLTHHTLLKLIRCYGFNGDIAHVSKYMNMCNTMFPENKCDKTMLLIAHKIALQNICKELEHTRGARGLSLKPDSLPELDQLHASWSDLTKDMFTGQPVDITDCNVVLEYLTLANRIDPVQFPMEMAEEIFESYMPANYIKPNDASHRIMLVGYSTSQQYNDYHRNIRLDKALEVVSKMQVAGINTLNHPTFHSLFRACLPHRDGNYYFDNFRLNSLLPARPYTHTRFKLDHRVFEIESIMLEAKLPHDRFTFTTLMTCLAAGGQHRALRSRWRALKVHGLRRDLGMYRLAFALASLHPTQAKRAIVVVRNEMKREIAESRVDWDTYTAMLDCCVTAQLPMEAKDIMMDMRKAAKLANRKKAHADDLVKWPFVDEPDFYLPMLRTAVSLPELNAEKILKEMEDKGIDYNQGIYAAVLSKLAVENDEQGIRRLFNKYTMSRFEKEGKIPVPVREAAQPVVPFPTAPYNSLDMQFIDVYICSLLDSQDISLVFDVLRTLVDQTDKIGISRNSLEGIVRLAKQEKDKEDLVWLKEQVLPKVTGQNKSLRLLKKKIDNIIN